MLQIGLSPGAATHSQEGTINTVKMEEGVGKGVLAWQKAMLGAARACHGLPGAERCCPSLWGGHWSKCLDQSLAPATHLRKAPRGTILHA